VANWQLSRPLASRPPAEDWSWPLAWTGKTNSPKVGRPSSTGPEQLSTSASAALALVSLGAAEGWDTPSCRRQQVIRCPVCRGPTARGCCCRCGRSRVLSPLFARPAGRPFGGQRRMVLADLVGANCSQHNGPACLSTSRLATYVSRCCC